MHNLKVLNANIIKCLVLKINTIFSRCLIHKVYKTIIKLEGVVLILIRTVIRRIEIAWMLIRTIINRLEIAQMHRLNKHFRYHNNGKIPKCNS